MLSHKQIWNAIDALAARYGHSPSGLAKAAGLDATAFNKSKRAGPSGRPRWPSVESIAKILQATGASLNEFVALIERGSGRAGSSRKIPVVGLAKAGRGGYFDDAGYPAGNGWDDVAFSSVDDKDAYALEVTGDSMLPLYRPGDLIVVSPNSDVRKGDRVVAKLRNGEVTVKILGQRNQRTVELESVNPSHATRKVDPKDIVWLARVVWAQQ